MEIKSTAFQNNTLMDKKYTCNGENINPPLEFIDIPQETKSLVLIMEDPDVPFQVREDRMWNHWIKFNIPPETVFVPEMSEPDGRFGMGTEGNGNYYGPCPPDGEHRYFFKLYALNEMLDLDNGATKEEIEEAMKGKVLDKAELIGLYEQPDKFKTINYEIKKHNL